MNIVILGIIGMMAFCASFCNKNSLNHPVLNVSLKEKSVSIFDLFQEVELIPLSTTQESVFSYTENIDVCNDTIFIFDRILYALYMFGPDGRFINKIHKVGRGPGEYTMASDFVIDSRDRTIHLLNPMGIVSEYDFEGKFISEVHLPKPPMNYRFFEILDSNNYVTWSSVCGKDNGAVNILNNKLNQFQNRYFPYSCLWSSIRYGSIFNKYKDTVYYHETLSNKVYSISANDYRIAYEWDTGIQLIDSETLKVSENKIVTAQEKLFEDFQDGTIPFFFGQQFQSKKYYYALLTFSNPVMRKSLFYDRFSDENRLFAKTIEGIALDLKYMTDDYALGLINYEDRDIFKNIVSENDAKLLDKMKDDDNPMLVKYTIR